MLSITPQYARLEIEKDQAFTDVTESFRSLLQICRMNGLQGALVVSRQRGFDLRSSLRVALKFVATRPAPLPEARLAVVANEADDRALAAIDIVAREIGLEFRGFHDEAAAIAWLTGVS